MKNEFESRRKTIHYLVIVVIIAVMLATYYLPDLLYGLFDDDPKSILVYAYCTRFLVAYVCILAMVVFYLVNVIRGFIRKTHPKDFFKPSKWVVRGIFTILFIAASVLFIADTTATVKDYNSDITYQEVDVMNVVNMGNTTRFSENTGVDVDDAPLLVCHSLDGIEMQSGHKYRFVWFKHTNTVVAVEDLGLTNLTPGEGS